MMQDDEEMMEIEFSSSPMHDENENGTQSSAANGRRSLFKSHASYSKVTSGGSSHDGSLQVDPEFQSYSLSRLFASWCTGLSYKRPRLFGATVVVLALVIPFMIATIVLSSLLISHLHSSDKSPTSSANDYSDYSVTSSLGVVATDNPICSQIGADVLDRGGNAVDAAVAAAFCLGVISPGASGIGGGCYLLYYNENNGDRVFIDSREVAPAAAHATMFESEPLKAQNGGLAVAVLAEVKGLHLAFERYGSGNVTWSSLLEPAAVLAESWTVSKVVETTLLEVEPQLKSGNFPGLSALYLTSEGNLKVHGDTVQEPQLAHTLRQIGIYGPAYIYETMAPVLAAEINAAGGNMTAHDISSYEPNVLTPISAEIAGYEYLGVGGSSSGGAVVLGLLKYLFSYDQPLTHWGDLYYQRLIEGMKHVFAIRLALGDPDYVNTTAPFDALLSDTYMEHLRSLSSDTHTLPLDNYGGVFNVTYSTTTDHGTSHISVFDASGRAVSMTSTINTYFGSKVVSPSTGILFNDQMDDFSIPGAANYFGLAPSPLNYPAPGKKPLSSMSPSMLLTLPSVSAASSRVTTASVTTKTTKMHEHHSDKHVTSTTDDGHHRLRRASKSSNDEGQSSAVTASETTSSLTTSSSSRQKVRLIGGASGGPRIITATAQVP